MTYKLNLLLLLLVAACNAIPTGKDIVQKSISFHDPHGKWNKMQQQILLKSTFVYPDSASYDLAIGLDNPGKKVSYSNTTLGQQVDFSDSNCVVVKGDKTCEQAAWTKNFYHFILGLPMTLQNDEGKIKEAFEQTNFKDTKCYKVQIDFVKEKWHFYFSEEDYHLVGFTFDKNFEDKAEEIQTEGIIEIDSIKFCKMRSWWITTDALNPIYSGKDEIQSASSW